ncbi:MAG: twitching motility protein PilT [Deltaproteobacteria bacterium RIFOXYD12_FULL_55_16]|nr:MAG: twitching motility protein PilT [Deltaproteobacteria bacterium RIFOXYD12_FULL_55_16]
MVYIDTSVVVALLTVEPRTPEIVTWYGGLRDTPITSDWLLTEFSSALSIKLRTGQINEGQARLVRKEFELLAGGGLRIVSVSRDAFRQAAEMVTLHDHGLRAGDSLHLAVALELKTSHMATLDATLATNAKRLGIGLVKF